MFCTLQALMGETLTAEELLKVRRTMQLHALMQILQSWAHASCCGIPLAVLNGTFDAHMTPLDLSSIWTPWSHRLAQQHLDPCLHCLVKLPGHTAFLLLLRSWTRRH